METSAEIKDLAAALATVQGKLTFAAKDSVNPHFKSKYADLASVWDSCRSILSEHGIAVVQGNRVEENKVVVETMLAHSSGQWMRSAIAMSPKDFGPQAIGSCITYGRRYGLAAMVGIVADEDDDGEGAEGRGKNRIPAKEMKQTGRTLDHDQGKGIFTNGATSKQLGEIVRLADVLGTPGLGQDIIDNHLTTAGVQDMAHPLRYLNSKEASDLINNLKEAGA